MIVKKHVRPNPQKNIKGGIAEQESRIAISNVQHRLPVLRPGTYRSRGAGRQKSSSLQEVRDDAG